MLMFYIIQKEHNCAENYFYAYKTSSTLPHF